MRRRLIAAGLTALLATSAAPPAGAAPAVPAPSTESSADTAGSRAAALSERVDRLHRRAEASLRSYEQALDHLSAAMATANQRSRTASDTGEAALRAQTRWEARVRALYTSGGAVPLYASLLQAADAGDALDLLTVADRLLSADATAVRSADASARRAELSAASATRATESLLLATRKAQEAAAVVAFDLRAEEALLRSASADVARLLAARTARLAATRQRAAEVSLPSAVTPAVAPASPEYLQLYRDAAATCPGLDWRVLAAIGQVESAHGRNPGTSSAGARGPMQFLPATFAAYGVDGDSDGDRDIDSPADAIHSAAHYLCRTGAGDGRLGAALWHYNHAQWYVDLVLRLADSYGQANSTTTGA